MIGDRRLLEVLESPAFQRRRHAVVVDEAGRLIGILSIKEAAGRGIVSYSLSSRRMSAGRMASTSAISPPET